MHEREDAHGLQARGGRDVELVNHVADERQHIAAGGDDEDVREVVGLDGQRGAGLGVLAGARRGGGVLQRAEPRDLRLEALGAGHRRALGEDTLQHRHEARGGGVLEAEQLQLGYGMVELFVQVLDELRGQLDGLGLAAEDERIRPRVHAKAQRVDERFAGQPLGLRAGAAGASRERAALREDALHRGQHRRGVGVLELDDADVHAFGNLRRVQQLNHGGERLQVVRRRGEHEAVAAADAVGGNLDGLGQVQRDGLAVVAEHTEPADLLLQLARLRRLQALRAGANHVLQHERERRRVGLLQGEDHHLGLDVGRGLVERLNHLLHLENDRLARDDEQAA